MGNLDKFNVRCECGKEYSLTVDKLGLRAKCICGRIFTVSKPPIEKSLPCSEEETRTCPLCNRPIRILQRKGAIIREICPTCEINSGICPLCGAELRTAKSQQCMICAAEWHSSISKISNEHVTEKKVEHKEDEKDKAPTSIEWEITDAAGNIFGTNSITNVAEGLLSGKISLDDQCFYRRKFEKWQSKPKNKRSFIESFKREKSFRGTIRNTLGKKEFEIQVLFEPKKAYRKVGFLLGTLYVFFIQLLLNLFLWPIPVMDYYGFGFWGSVLFVILFFVTIPTVIGPIIVSYVACVISGTGNAITPIFGLSICVLVCLMIGAIFGGLPGWIVGHIKGSKREPYLGLDKQNKNQIITPTQKDVLYATRDIHAWGMMPFILGIQAFLTFGITAIPSIILGIKGLRESNLNSDSFGDKSLCRIGIILSIIAVLLYLGALIYIIST